jgi:hypothetical protein
MPIEACLPPPGLHLGVASAADGKGCGCLAIVTMRSATRWSRFAELAVLIFILPFP